MEELFLLFDTHSGAEQVASIGNVRGVNYAYHDISRTEGVFLGITGALRGV